MLDQIVEESGLNVLTAGNQSLVEGLLGFDSHDDGGGAGVVLRSARPPHHLQDLGLVVLAVGTASSSSPAPNLLGAFDHHQMGGEVDAQGQGSGRHQHGQLAAAEGILNQTPIGQLKTGVVKSNP